MQNETNSPRHIRVIKSAMKFIHLLLYVGLTLAVIILIRTTWGVYLV